MILADFFRNGQGKTLKEAASKWELDSFPAVGTTSATPSVRTSSPSELFRLRAETGGC
jgi:hypothetical protein